MADTIFALATAPGRAAVAVIRLSGPGAGAALRTLAGPRLVARKALLRDLRRPDDGTLLDRSLVLWFPAPRSYTGEDGAELHLHGGVAVVEGVVAALLSLGLRLAEPGEFTRRAFENGKLDLTQAEAVADLVDAETDAQRRQALSQLDGALARRHATWRADLIEALAVLEAAVDFPDEDLPAAAAAEAAPIIDRVIEDLVLALEDDARGERVREGFRVAIIGPPNAGKSSLLNALAGRSAAIVTATPGTTRDVIEIPLTVAGYRVLLADTAGLRATQDPIEAEGVRRARAWAASAALRLLVVDASDDGGEWTEAFGQVQPGDYCILNKRDLPPGATARHISTWVEAYHLKTIDLSLADGDASPVWSRLEARVVHALSGGDFPAATQARHRADLSAALDHLARARRALLLRMDVELVAEDVRLAARCLARIGGRIGAEDVLDRVFARFCIGK
jgi:tRNA modification GTPase